MKDTPSWISVLIGVGYIIFKIILPLQKRKVESTHQYNEDEKADWESEFDWKKTKWPIEETNDILHPKQEVLKSTTINTRKAPFYSHKIGAPNNNPSSPGIKKSLLPTQEQNPYKLYNMANPPSGNRLNKVLNKYSNAHKGILIAEILRRKTKV
jgi:hypothetical protein